MDKPNFPPMYCRFCTGELNRPRMIDGHHHVVCACELTAMLDPAVAEARRRRRRRACA